MYMHPYLGISSISDTDPGFWSGKRVLVRADLNVPAAEGPYDFMRVDALFPTLQYLLDHDARIVVIAHRDDSLSFKSISDYIAKKFTVSFIESLPTGDDYLGNHARTGQISILENLRLNPGEELNDPELVTALVRGFDYFVQDAFSVCHRKHASIIGIPEKLQSFVGLQCAKEINHLAGNPDTGNMVLIVGGAKFGTKLPLIERYLDKASKIYVGGALAHSIYKSRGYEIGASKFDEGVSVAHIARHPRVFVPQYVLVERSDKTTAEVLATDVGPYDTIVDAGSASFGIWDHDIISADTIIWNGPLGWYERGYFGATKTLAGIIAQSSGMKIVGGGDTVAALASQNLLDKFSFVSLAGGAMLDFLANDTLPGLEVLINK